MKEASFTLNYRLADRLDELSAQELTLFEAAVAAREMAYAPYSNYKVGAALRLDSGRIVMGNNQENAAYPSGLCAERVALFAARSQYPNERIEAIAVMTDGAVAALPASPCGACRQVMVEFEALQNSPIQVILASMDGRAMFVRSSADLLPFCFTCEQLQAGKV